MRSHTLPVWMRYGLLTGADEKESEEESSEEEGSEEEGEENDDESEDDEDDSDESERDNEALKKALATERKERRKLERAVKRLSREKGKKDTQEELDLETAKTEAAESKKRAETLAARLLKSEVDLVINEVASELKFRDLSDARAAVDRDEIDVDQDEDDPSDVEVDRDTVRAALEEVLRKKPHYKKPEGEDQASGAGGAGRKKRKDGELDDETLKKQYPSLGSRVPIQN